MPFLIGVIFLALFIIFGYLFIRNKIKQFTRKYFGGNDLKSIIEEARLEDEEVPKSLSSMDSIYLEQIKHDFPDLNINELKRMSENEIISVYKAIETKNIKDIKCEKIKNFINKVISSLKNDSVGFKCLKIHTTVVSKYEKSGGVATIYLSTAFEYLLYKNDKLVRKVQDRVKTEYIYVIDASKISISKKVIGVNCPNCGSPITDLSGNCCYCGSKIIDIVSRVWMINDMIKY